MMQLEEGKFFIKNNHKHNSSRPTSLKRSGVTGGRDGKSSHLRAPRARTNGRTADGWRGWRGRIPEGRWGEGRQQVAVPAMVSNKVRPDTRHRQQSASQLGHAVLWQPTIVSVILGGGSHDAATQRTRAKHHLFNGPHFAFDGNEFSPGGEERRGLSLLGTYLLLCYYLLLGLLLLPLLAFDWVVDMMEILGSTS
jgi:hypothetical protein